MNPVPDHNAAAWLDDLLSRGVASPPADDGFSAKVMERIDTVARSAAAAAPAPCISPAAALRRLPAVQQRERRRQSWTTAGVLAAAAIGMLTTWAQPGLASSAALVLTSMGLLWLLLRDPQF
jgi:hypothetical protein